MTVSPFVSSWHSNEAFSIFSSDTNDQRVTMLKKNLPMKFYKPFRKWISTSHDDPMTMVKTRISWRKREAGEKTGIKRAIHCCHHHCYDLPKPRWQMAWFFSEFKLPSTPLLSSHLEAIISLKGQNTFCCCFWLWKLFRCPKLEHFGVRVSDVSFGILCRILFPFISFRSHNF